MEPGEELLLHVCCAPCATYVIDVLSEQYSVTIFFYNPNIYPDKEYQRRLGEVRRYAALHDVPLIVAEPDVAAWYERVRGHEQESEGGKRCELCFAIRLDRTAAAAVDRGIRVFTTTLSVSPYKDFRLIERVGLNAAHDYGISFLARDFKKNDGYRKSCALSKEYGLYRQHYCGCRYSMKDTEHGKKT
ncbi:MAG: epoxyqueuosine reductase QueH [Desulfobacterota bacterium]|nr:epoxyqueuosine reductase QueH [Thermodesulfobacteriota bacterium]